MLRRLRPGSRSGLALLSFALLSFALLVFAAACGDDTTTPPPRDLFAPQPDQGPNPCANCPGCCLGGTQCMGGNTESACGFGGLTCQTCATNDQCTAGTCVPKQAQCGPANCATGCCQSGVCIKPPSTASCGINGAVCSACKTGETCDAGACKVKGPTTYSVKIVSAEVKNSDCGWGDDCDVFVEVSLGGGAVVKTPTITSENPLWNFKLFDATDTGLLTTKLKAVVIDDDGLLNPNDKLGTCELTITQKDLDAGELITDCKPKVKNLKFSFTAAP